MIGLGSGFSARPFDERARIAQRLLPLYEEDPDPGVHGAVEWTLKKWGFEKQVFDLRSRLAGVPRGGKGWFVTPKLHTMIVVRGPVRFLVGSPDDEPGRDINEGRHEVTIDYSFAVSAHEVTFAQYRECDHGAYRNPAITPSEECPKSFVSWISAGRYCNWLTEQAGMHEDEQCYPAEHGDRTKVRVPDDFLHRPGFRLPTVHEWEYVARSGAVTSRFFGNAESDLVNYAWFGLNSGGRTWPVGSLRPNPLGFFDLYGNVFEWCEFAPPAGTWEMGPLRGGGFRSMERYLRSAMPGTEKRAEDYSYLGFRIAMTLDNSRD